MPQNKKQVKLFTEWRTYKRSSGTIVQVSPPPGDIEKRINQFAASKMINIEAISSTVTDLSSKEINDLLSTVLVEYTVIYSQDVEEVVFKDEAPSLEELPIPKEAKSPTVLVKVNTDDGIKSAHAMAGVFGVIEGNYFGDQDVEVAPPVLLSPNCDMTKYKNLFGNIQRVA